MIMTLIIVDFVLCAALGILAIVTVVMDLRAERRYIHWLDLEIREAKNDMWDCMKHGDQSGQDVAAGRLEILREIRAIALGKDEDHG